MTPEQWIQTHLPKGKNILSTDAVEILIKLAWEEAQKLERKKHVKPEKEVTGPYAIEELY